MVLRRVIWAVLSGLLAGCGGGSTDSPNLREEAVSRLTAHRQQLASAGGPTDDVLPTGQLSIGRRFRFLKTIEHTVSGADGETASTRLSVLMTLHVLDVVDDRTASAQRDIGDRFLRIDYDSIGYLRDLGGEQIRYDSLRDTGVVPSEALRFGGMAGSGFSFWMDGHDESLRTTDFHEFLETCLSGVSAERRAAFRHALGTAPDGQRVRRFVHESLGVFSREMLRTGSRIERSTRVLHPIALDVVTTYVVRETSEDMATVEISGHIASPVELSAPRPAISEFTATVHDGRTFGNWTIDRRTGLPVDGRVTREFGLALSIDGESPISQTNRTVTTIRALADDFEPTTAAVGRSVR